MGQELQCRMHYRSLTFSGKAWLETECLLFRGEERLKLPFADLTGVSAADGVLALDFPGGPARFELGAAAARWAEKILHPPSLLDKLGVKPGMPVRLAGTFDEEFRSQLNVVKGPSATVLVFFAARTAAGLRRVPDLAAMLPPKGALWIVYPKCVSAIREIEVIHAGREAGLKDIKVVRFSASHTALKFVAPSS
jgi:hypothetical protein